MQLRRLVVGVDGSRGSAAALRFALDEAVAHEAEVLVVHAWEAGFDSVFPNDALSTSLAAAMEEAAELVHGLVAVAQAERARPVEHVSPHAVQGEAADVLLSQVRDGDLLVVGANSGGIVRRLVLGSVCAKVVQGARCPVTVVPAPPVPQL